MANHTTVPSWAVTPEKVEEAVRKIIEVSHPEKIILFGSYVRGATGRNSDLDILVVTSDTVENPRRESVRIRRALRGIPMPMDILVIPRSQWEKLKDVPGLIYREALKTGKVVYECSQAA
ncbi:MAG: nucleotidyltransferase domain-containing protein [Bryobacteraceae bacterium]